MLSTLVLTLTLAHMPGFFEPNIGQFGDDILYVARSTTGMMLFTNENTVDSNGMILEMPRARGSKFVLRDREDGSTNYPGAVYVPRYAKLMRLDVAPGIDAIYTLDQQGAVQCDFLAHEGADPATLEILFKGVDRLFVDSKGKLTVRTMTGKNIEPALRLFRMVEGRQVAVDVQPVIRRDGVVMLAVLAN